MSHASTRWSSRNRWNIGRHTHHCRVTPWSRTTAGPDPASAVAAAQDLERVLGTLDEEDRALILMKFAEGHDYDELAEMFNATAGALRT
jgi:DNA-directed RNA polymerase specialized sigma24 family protein